MNMTFEVVGDNEKVGNAIHATVLIEWMGATYTTLMTKNLTVGMVTLDHVEESIVMLDYIMLMKEVEKQQKELKNIIK